MGGGSSYEEEVKREACTHIKLSAVGVFSTGACLWEPWKGGEMLR